MKKLNVTSRLLSLLIVSATVIPSLQAANQSAFISKIYDFSPAPGQFINEMPLYDEGDTKEDMIRKVEESICGDEKGLVSLGGYGGSMVFGFDHTVVNVVDKYDFKIWGNAFYAASNPNEGAPSEGGSCEPGIVMVSYDSNKNGIPDDEWYELAGSEYSKPSTIKNYKITYFKPDPNAQSNPDPDYEFITDRNYIKWESNQNTSGYIARNVFNRQPYYPAWVDDSVIEFEGTKLADNYIDESGVGSYYVLYSYPWGYADNHPNSDERSNFKIEWAVDKDGNPVNLTGVDFIKVYTGVNQYCGWLGETSTDIMGAEDLNVGASIDAAITDSQDIAILQNPVRNQLVINNFACAQRLDIYSIAGNLVLATTIEEGRNYIDATSLMAGIYIVKTDKISKKIIKL